MIENITPSYGEASFRMEALKMAIKIVLQTNNDIKFPDGLYELAEANFNYIINGNHKLINKGSN